MTPWAWLAVTAAFFAGTFAGALVIYLGTCAHERRPEGAPDEQDTETQQDTNEG